MIQKTPHTHKQKTKQKRLLNHHFHRLTPASLRIFRFSIPPSVLPFTHTFWDVLAQWFACVFVCHLQHSATFSRLTLRGADVINSWCPHSSFQILAGDFSAWLRVPETQTGFATFVRVFLPACVVKDKCSATTHSHNLWEAWGKFTAFSSYCFFLWADQSVKSFLTLHSALICLTFLTGKWEHQ